MSHIAAQERLRRLLDEKARRACNTSLALFTMQAWHIIEPNTNVNAETGIAEPLWNDHLDVICDDLEAISRDLVSPTPPATPPHEVFNVPPRYMKSIVISIMWPVWEWGPFACPWSRWIFGSHDAKLATDHSVARRTIIESEWYQRRWGHLFELSTDQNVKTQFSNTRRGTMFSTSVSGAKIGRGGDRIVLDDPHDPEKILSDDIRERDVRIIRQGFSTRLNDKKRGAIVCVMQRLHEQDATSYFITLGYRRVSFPNPAPDEGVRVESRAGRVVERKAGELLWPAREDATAVATMRRTLGEYAFAGQYLQTPSPIGGVIFKRDDWRFYSQLPASYDAKAISIDCSFKAEDDSDFVASLVGIFVGGNTYLVELTKERMTFSGTCEHVKTLRARHPDASHVYIEDKANGTAVIDSMKTKIAGLIAVNPEGGKIARAWGASGDVESHNVYLPEYLDEHGTVIPGREWVADFIENASKFPKVAHDDDVDAFTQLIIARRKGFAAILEVLKQQAAQHLAAVETAIADADAAKREQRAERVEGATAIESTPAAPTMTVEAAMTIFGR
jgi:predicted phage terminase large subunit-like protein